MHRLTMERLERISLKAKAFAMQGCWAALKELYLQSCAEEEILDAGLGYLPVWCFLVGIQEKEYLAFRDNTEAFPPNEQT